MWKRAYNPFPLHTPSSICAPLQPTQTGYPLAPSKPYDRVHQPLARTAPTMQVLRLPPAHRVAHTRSRPAAPACVPPAAVLRVRRAQTPTWRVRVVTSPNDAATAPPEQQQAEPAAAAAAAAGQAVVTDAPQQQAAAPAQQAESQEQGDSQQQAHSDEKSALKSALEDVVQHDKVHVDGIMMQGFNWESCRQGGWYNYVATKIPDLQAAGVTHVWLPPPSQSVSPEGYMPGQLYKLDSKYGSAEELKQLLAKLREAGIDPLCDVVINHRCADTQDEHGRWNNFHDDVTHEGHSIDWGRWAITSDDPVWGGQGGKDTGDDWHGAPDLDHANPLLREALVHWLQHLRANIGYRGWRFDFAKGFAAKFIKQYVQDSGADVDLNVGELWVDMQWEDGGVLAYNQDAARQRLCDWIDGHDRSACAFDFPTKGILQYAVGHCQYWRLSDEKRKPPGLMGWWPSKAVTFIANHDCDSTQNHWPFPKDKVAQGYAYILSHPGMPTLFWDHLFDWGSTLKGEILAQLKVRRDAGIGARSQVEILAAEADMYVSRTTGKLGQVLLKLGPKYDMGALAPKEGDGWARAAKGTDWCMWIKLHDEQQA